MPSRLPGRSAALLFLLAFVVSPLPAQKRRSANLDENIQLPADFAMDYQLGLTMRSQIHGSNSLLTDTPMNLAGDAVFKN
jgi:hypothetical protein